MNTTSNEFISFGGPCVLPVIDCGSGSRDQGLPGLPLERAQAVHPKGARPVPASRPLEGRLLLALAGHRLHLLPAVADQEICGEGRKARDWEGGQTSRLGERVRPQCIKAPTLPQYCAGINFLLPILRRWDVVVNCVGSAAKQLCQDRLMTVNRGQVSPEVL